ncbi:MAG: hypothetical protein HQK79_02490 [Desulfobacterales bacterium]|nr:hypothetical protein [Desulfobacterales bacterium]MBF0396512.1 hypothetical protein [Desulfobacterales bacterium]
MVKLKWKIEKDTIKINHGVQTKLIEIDEGQTSYNILKPCEETVKLVFRKAA